MIRESASSGESEDDELDDWTLKNMDFIDTMIASDNEVDERLLSLFTLRMAERGKGDAAGEGEGEIEGDI